MLYVYCLELDQQQGCAFGKCFNKHVIDTSTVDSTICSVQTVVHMVHEANPD